MRYVPCIIGACVLYVLCLVYDGIVRIVDDPSILWLLFIFFELVLILDILFLLVVYPRLFTHGSILSEGTISFLTGFVGGIFGLLLIYNMNTGSIIGNYFNIETPRQRVGWTNVILAIFYIIALVINATTALKYFG